MDTHNYDSSNYPVSEFEILASAIGNALFEDMDLLEVWEAIMLSSDAVDLDTALDAKIWLKDVVSDYYSMS